MTFWRRQGSRRIDDLHGEVSPVAPYRDRAAFGPGAAFLAVALLLLWAFCAGCRRATDGLPLTPITQTRNL